jgi:Tol biopolymer transport system component
VYRVSGEGVSNNDIWVKPLNPDGEPIPLLATPFNESYAELSPNGRWLAYVSDESERGQGDIYVTAFPSGSGKVRVSPAGGHQPRWRRDGRELYYMTPDRMLMRVGVDATGPTFTVETPTPLFQTESDRGAGPQYIVTADGQRFLVNTEVPSGAQSTLSVVFNWQSLLKPREP